MNRILQASIIVVSVLGAFLVFGWFDTFHLLFGIPALVGLFFLFRWWRKRTAAEEDDYVSAYDDTEGASIEDEENPIRLIIFGLIKAVIVVVALLLVFAIGSKTFVYGWAYDKDWKEIQSEIATMRNVGAHQQAAEKCELRLKEDLSKKKKIELAKTLYSTLVDWGNSLKGNEALEKYQAAIDLAKKREFDGSLAQAQLGRAQAEMEADKLRCGPRELRAGSQVAISSIDISGFPGEITARITANDAEGNFIAWLEKRDFVVLNDGVDIEFAINKISEAGQADFVIAMDTSGSVKGEALTQGKHGVKGLIKQISGNDRVELISFGNTAIRKTGWTSDREEVYKAVDALNAQGETALYDAVAMAITDLRISDGINKAVIICTDGKDTVSKAGAVELAALIEESKIPVYIIGLKTKDLDIETMKNIANASHGEYFEASEPAELITLLMKAGNKVKSGYKISISPSWPPGQHAGTHTLKVSVGSNPIIGERSYDL